MRLLAVAAAMFFSHQAMAYSIDVLSDGNAYRRRSQYGSVATFDAVTADALRQDDCHVGPLTDGGALFSGGRRRDEQWRRRFGRLYATPYGDPTNYMAVSAAAARRSLIRPGRSFGLYWGSVDTYNVLTSMTGRRWSRPSAALRSRRR